MNEMPPIETSWGYGPVTGVEDFEGDDGTEQVEVTHYNAWTVYCLRHGFSIEANLIEPEVLAQCPDLFCPICEEEWANFINRVRRALPPDDLAADEHRWLEELRGAEERDRDRERRTLGR